MRTDNKSVSTLKENGIILSEPKDKADGLNRQFVSVFIQETPMDPENVPIQKHPTMPEINITARGIEKLLKNLNIQKAAGPDQTAPQVLKDLAEVLAPILTAIFRKSYETGEVPLVWKSANDLAIFKKDVKCKPSNYRPVSLTCICCKIMEHIVTSNVMSHNKLHGILYRFQHGFRSLRSCEIQLLEFITDVTNNMHNGKQPDILIMDFSKAFDKVGYEHLLAKLVHYGITGKTNNWIRSFLYNRKQTGTVG